VAAASANVPMTASAAAKAVSTHVERDQLTAPGIALHTREGGKRTPWPPLSSAGQPDVQGPPPPEVRAVFSFRASKHSKSMQVALGGPGPLNQVIAAANRVASRCHAARLKALLLEGQALINSEGQALINAVADGSFSAMMKERFQQALAAVRAGAEGGAAGP
jgi:hypothetical protein